MNTLIMIPSMLFYQNAERTKYKRAKWIPNMANLNLLDEVSLTKYWNKLHMITVFLKKMDLLLNDHKVTFVCDKFFDNILHDFNRMLNHIFYENMETVSWVLLCFMP